MTTPPAASLLVLTYQWTEPGDGFGGPSARQETYGPWTVADDESHLEQVFAFIRDWPRLTGCEPSAITMAQLTDPAAWAQEREAQQG